MEGLVPPVPPSDLCWPGSGRCWSSSRLSSNMRRTTTYVQLCVLAVTLDAHEIVKVHVDDETSSGGSIKTTDQA